MINAGKRRESVAEAGGRRGIAKAAIAFRLGNI